MAKKFKFLKSASVGKTFSAQFSNGEKTTSHDAATFFMQMDDKGATADEAMGYISMGMMVDPSHDWAEIKRIAKSFIA